MVKNRKIIFIIILFYILSLAALSIKCNKSSIILGFTFVPLSLINLFPLLFYKAPLTKLELKKFDTIIVLGYPGTPDGKPSPIMRERVFKAVELFNKGYANFIICSGGSVYNKYIEADIMIKLAKSLGVPDSCLVRENKSINTYGNLLNSIDIMRRMNWSSAIVITSPWHLRRSSYLLSKFNITYVMKKSNYPKEFSVFYIVAIYIFENYTMFKNKILYH
ncbi:hypothetical protein Ctaglu_21730 [Clostridium tagluense]|uniref:DUF218 domain-containing protein n=1 Tax=Clostridium tagluense TaxID=360422 RepID=A0A401ULY7_9CLOT|nr:hypothetical protein Ctaglu_21730 [Clostridium tagluense]